MIQLIDAAEDSEQQQWLVDNYDRLKTLAQYPETLMYDLVDPILDWSGDADFEFVNQLLDDLTMTSPYDLGYWEFAAQTAMDRQDDPERALGFVEYALAINPNSVKSLVIKSECLLRAQNLMSLRRLKQPGRRIWPSLIHWMLVLLIPMRLNPIIVPMRP